MEGFGRQVVYPTVEQICEVNRRMIDSFGGRFVPPDNFQNRGSLEYIIVAIESPLFGQDIYPTLKQKAAAIAYQIISRHVFIDGNKRTAVHTAWEFLQSNEIPLYLDPTIVDLAVAVAQGSAGYGELLEWLHSHQDA